MSYSMDRWPNTRSILLLFPGTDSPHDNFSGWIEGEWNDEEQMWETVVGTMGTRNVPVAWAELPDETVCVPPEAL